MVGESELPAVQVLAGKLDGRLMGVGRGDRGQLGMGGADRDDKERWVISSGGSEKIHGVFCIEMRIEND